jgi:hypothetical protein
MDNVQHNYSIIMKRSERSLILIRQQIGIPSILN